MQTPKVCELACQSIRGGEYPFIVLNFANPDMVGHTGILEAGVVAVDSVDRAFGELLQATQEAGGILLVTADHGNVEQMIDLNTGEPHTAHTTNPVPFVVADFSGRNGTANGTSNKGWHLEDGTLADVAPTVLQLMGIEKPPEMNGHSLLKR